MSELLRLEDIHKWVGEGETRTEILRGISLTLEEGGFTAVMGASGSGKSTLLNIMGLLDTPSAGSVWLMGKKTSRMSDDELAEQRARCIGFIFQSFNLISYLTAQDNIALPLAYARQAREPGQPERLLERVKLLHRMQAYPATLSGGERQRVAIARALANKPAVLLADEPTGSLDSTTGREIMDLMGELHRQGTTLVLVTHDEQIARRADRIYRMKDGRFV
jgi:ABC-type lipoprotein export system ATPase subunit